MREGIGGVLLVPQHGAEEAQDLRAERAQSAAEWTEVARCYRLAADSGHPSAMIALAQLYESGRGLASDRASALTLYRQAFESGHADAGLEVRRLEAQLREAQLQS